jgi:hypothetical protein
VERGRAKLLDGYHVDVLIADGADRRDQKRGGRTRRWS